MLFLGTENASIIEDSNSIAMFIVWLTPHSFLNGLVISYCISHNIYRLLFFVLFLFVSVFVFKTGRYRNELWTHQLTSQHAFLASCRQRQWHLHWNHLYYFVEKKKLNRSWISLYIILDGIPVPERVKIAKTSNDYL